MDNGKMIAQMSRFPLRPLNNGREKSRLIPLILIIGHDKISDILHRSRASFLQLLRFLLDHIPVSHLLNSRQKRAAQFITDSGLMIQYQ